MYGRLEAVPLFLDTVNCILTIEIIVNVYIVYVVHLWYLLDWSEAEYQDLAEFHWIQLRL